MHAPALLPYEVRSALPRLVAAGEASAEAAPQLWAPVRQLPIDCHPLGDDLSAAVRWSLP